MRALSLARGCRPEFVEGHFSYWAGQSGFRVPQTLNCRTAADSTDSEVTECRREFALLEEAKFPTTVLVSCLYLSLATSSVGFEIIAIIRCQQFFNNSIAMVHVKYTCTLATKEAVLLVHGIRSIILIDRSGFFRLNYDHKLGPPRICRASPPTRQRQRRASSVAAFTFMWALHL